MKLIFFWIIYFSLFSLVTQAGIEEEPRSSQNYKINEDGSYQYDVRLKSRKDESSAIHFGVVSAPQITIEPKVGTTFGKMYGNGPFPIVLYDWEFYKFESIPELCATTGFGVFSTSGKGRFAQVNGVERIAKESYTFLGLPLSLGLNYNLVFSERPWVMAQLGLGGSYFAFTELREDGKSNLAGSAGYYSLVSILFNVTKFDAQTSFIMDREYNIRNLWLSFEYRNISTFKSDLDASAGISSMGFLVEY